jgi:hypothetical protein
MTWFHLSLSKRKARSLEWKFEDAEKEGIRDSAVPRGEWQVLFWAWVGSGRKRCTSSEIGNPQERKMGTERRMWMFLVTLTFFVRLKASINHERAGPSVGREAWGGWQGLRIAIASVGQGSGHKSIIQRAENPKYVVVRAVIISAPKTSIPLPAYLTLKYNWITSFICLKFSNGFPLL